MSIKTKTAISLFGLCLTSTVWAGPASSGPPATASPAARPHVDRGIELSLRRTPQDLEAAIREFQAAYEQSKEAYLLVNIGRCYHHLGKPGEALSYYQRAREQQGEVPASQEARRQRYEEEARALLPPQLVAPPLPALASPPTPPPPQHSRRWGLWLGLGLGTAAAVGLGLGLGLGLQPPPYLALGASPSVYP